MPKGISWTLIYLQKYLVESIRIFKRLFTFKIRKNSTWKYNNRKRFETIRVNANN